MLLHWRAETLRKWQFILSLIMSAQVDRDIVGKSFIYIFASLRQTQKGVLAKVVLQRWLLPVQQSAM